MPCNHVGLKVGCCCMSSNSKPLRIQPCSGSTCQNMLSGHSAGPLRPVVPWSSAQHHRSACERRHQRPAVCAGPQLIADLANVLSEVESSFEPRFNGGIAAAAGIAAAPPLLFWFTVWSNAQRAIKKAEDKEQARLGQEFDMNHLMIQLADLDMQLNRLQRSGLPASLTSTPPPTPASRGQTPHISGTSTPSWPAGLARADLDDMAAAYGLGPLDTASQLAQAAKSLCMQSTAGQKSVWDQIAELSRTGPGAAHRPGATLKRSASCSSVNGDRSSTYKQPRLVMGDDVIWLPVLDQSAPGADRLGFSRANQQLAGLGLSHLGGMSSDDLMGLSGPLPQQQGGSAGRLGEAEAVWAALAASSQAWPAVPTAVGREDHREEGWATFPEAWEPFDDAAPAAGAPSVVPDLMQWSVHSQRCPESEGLLPTPDLWASPGADCATSTTALWLPELDLDGTAGSTRVHTPHPTGTSGGHNFGLRMPSLDLGDLPRMGSPTAAAVALAGSQVDAAAGLSSGGNDGDADSPGAGAGSRAQVGPAGSAASGYGLPRAAAASSGVKADPAALEQLVLFSKLLVEAMGESGEGETSAGQAAAALRRLDSAGSSDSSTSGAAGAASTASTSRSPVMDPRDMQAVAAAMLLLREGDPGADPITAHGEVWGPHAGPAVAQAGSDLSSIYSQDFEELEGHSDLEVDFFSADEDAEDGPAVKADLGTELTEECLPEHAPWSKPVSRPSELGRVRAAWGERALHPGRPSLQPRVTSVTVATQTTEEGSLVLPEEHGVAVREPEASAAAALMASLSDAWRQAGRPAQEAPMIATECNQPGAQNPERQPQQHHRVLHLCRRPPPRPAVAGRALMRGFLLDGHQGSAQAACQAGEGVTRAVQLAPERHAAAAVEGALLRPADWLAAMAVNPVQGCRLAAHIQPQLPPLRQLLPPLGSQLLVPAHSPFVLPPELHPAKIIPGTERQRNMASIAASADAQVEAASPPMVATKAKAKELAAAAAAFVARKRHENLSLSAEQLAFCKRPSPELSAEEVDYMTLPASTVDADEIRRSHAVDLEDVASMCSDGSFVDCHLLVPSISCSSSVSGSIEVVATLEGRPSIPDSSDLAVESWALVGSGTAAGAVESAESVTSEDDGCAVIAADAEAMHEYASSQASEEDEWEVVHTETN